MGALKPQRRSRTARELAEEFDVHPRTIQRLYAEPREEYERRAAQRRAEAVRLRSEGRKITEIMALMGLRSKGAVASLLSEARKRGELNIERWTHAPKIAERAS